MGFTVGGLSTGLDTNTIISQLMAIEQQPITRMQNAEQQAASTLSSVKTFNDKLEALLSKADTLSSSDTLLSRTATTSTADYLTASADSSAVPGNYEIKVGRLAQVEKVVYGGVADKDTTTFGTGSLTINNDALSGPVSIPIDSSSNTLQGIRDAINAQKDATGVTASIVNDGSGTPYRLVLTGSSVSNANISLDTSGLSGGTALPSVDSSISRPATTALVQVDGILITSNSNTLTEAIPGVSLNLTAADPNFDPNNPDWSTVKSTNLEISTDKDGIQGKIQDFVSAFNDVVKAAADDNLSGDSGIRSIVSTLRSKFTDTSAGTGLFQLGIATQKDGSLLLDTSKLGTMLDNNISGFESLLAGDGTSDGIADNLKTALDAFTDSQTGLVAIRQTSYDNTVRRLDDEIAQAQTRLDAYQQKLVTQFANLETLVGNLNSQGSYLTQQMSALNGG